MTFNQLFDDSIVVLDGGLGTTLEDIFHKEISHTPLWSSKLIQEDPDTVVQAHLAFLRAGARVILTSTYQSSFSTFERAEYSRDDAQKIMLKSVHLAEEARIRFYAERKDLHANNVRIALSLGPFGATISPWQDFDGFYPPPYGPKAYSATDDNCNAFSDEPVKVETSIEALAQFHLERLSVFASDPETWGTIDCIAFETVPLAREVKALRRAIALLRESEAGSGRIEKPWWISLVFPDGQYPESEHPGGKRLSPRQLAEVVLKNEDRGRYAVPSAFGINCTKTHFLRRILIEVAQAVGDFSDQGLPNPWLVVYPNGGVEYDRVSQSWRDAQGGEEEDRTWAKELSQIIGEIPKEKWGGILVGGCCKTVPDDVEALTLNIFK